MDFRLPSFAFWADCEIPRSLRGRLLFGRITLDEIGDLLEKSLHVSKDILGLGVGVLPANVSCIVPPGKPKSVEVACCLRIAFLSIFAIRDGFPHGILVHVLGRVLSGTKCAPRRAGMREKNVLVFWAMLGLTPLFLALFIYNVVRLREPLLVQVGGGLAVATFCCIAGRLV